MTFGEFVSTEIFRIHVPFLQPLNDALDFDFSSCWRLKKEGDDDLRARRAVESVDEFRYVSWVDDFV